MAYFTVENLRKDQLGEAWPVVRTLGLEANFDWWLTDAAGLIDRGGGVLVARALNGSIHGVAAYGIAGKLPEARALTVDLLLSFELSGRAPARRALSKALEKAAAALDSTGFAIPLGASAG